MSVALTPGEYAVLSHFVRDVRDLSPDAFRERHGDAFLVHEAPSQRLQPLPRTKATVAFERPHLPMPAEHESGGVSIQRLDFAVFLVRRTGRSPFPNFISVGRAKSNDVIVEHETVSKFHAFFRCADGGDFVLQDGGSKNGTSIDGESVPEQNKGGPVIVRSGMRLRFGGVEVTFLATSEFCDLVRQSM